MPGCMNTLIKCLSLRGRNPVAQLTHSLFKALPPFGIEIQITTQYRLLRRFLHGNLVQQRIQGVGSPHVFASFS